MMSFAKDRKGFFFCKWKIHPLTLHEYMKEDDYLLESQKLLLVLKRVIDHDFDTCKLNFFLKT